MAKNINAAAESSTVKHFVTHLPCRLSRKLIQNGRFVFMIPSSGSCTDYVSLLYYKKACVSRANLKFLYVIFGAFVCRARYISGEWKNAVQTAPFVLPPHLAWTAGGRGFPLWGKRLIFA